jgi:hypothetical protein
VRLSSQAGLELIIIIAGMGDSSLMLTVESRLETYFIVTHSVLIFSFSNARILCCKKCQSWISYIYELCNHEFICIMHICVL